MRATQALLGRLRRLPLTTKQARKGFYKGNGTGLLGSFDPANPRKFIPDWNKIRTYKYPVTGLNGFKLTPFVVRNLSAKYVQSEDGETWEVPEKTLSGEKYLEMWKTAGGHDEVDEDEVPKK